MEVDLRSVCTTETGELCGTFMAFGECACTEDRASTCAMPIKRSAAKKVRNVQRARGWLSDALNKSGQVKTFDFATGEQVSTKVPPKAGEQPALF
ncbi:MAG: hypothetical protein ACYCZM_11965 [Acidimicrobiales bacterium]